MKGILWLAAKNQSTPKEPIFEQVAKHFHVTLQFGVESTEYSHLVGRDVEIRVEAVCFNDRVEALSVSLPEDICQLCRNAHPHMTISMAPGVKPVESNVMLPSQHNRTPVSYTIQTVVEFSPFNNNGS